MPGDKETQALSTTILSVAQLLLQLLFIITTDSRQLLLQEINHFCQALEEGRGCLRAAILMAVAKVSSTNEGPQEVETHP